MAGVGAIGGGRQTGRHARRHAPGAGLLAPAETLPSAHAAATPGAHAHRRGRLPVELSGLADHLSPAERKWAGDRARALGVGADEALIARGRISSDAAGLALCAHLGLPFDDLEGAPRFAPHLPEGASVAVGLMAGAALRTGTLAGEGPDGAPGFTIAARGRPARRLARALKADPGLSRRMALTTPERLAAFAARRYGQALASAAAFRLRDEAPDKSAATLSPAAMVGLGAAWVLGSLFIGGLLAPEATLLLVQGVLSVVFLAWIALRVAACFYEAEEEAPLDLPEARLPVYTLIVPLYREARVVPRLVRALSALDYPAEKLDIKLAVEEDDRETRAALATHLLPAHFHVVAAPGIGPRTKPKALNLALAYARGEFVGIYDAEDIPAPDQLRRALAAFKAGGPDVACVQARLAIDNGRESWISRHFAAEYAGLFDVLLPALSGLGLPVLLGGTSNHFRRAALESVGGWDPFNVTEDADLGIRLARAGWQTRVIASSTEEEAPIFVRAWIGQRTRWLKGWAQTILVHGRNPRALVRDVGLEATVALALLTVGPYASALVHPLCLGLILIDLWRGVMGLPCETLAQVVASALAYTTLVAGYLGNGLASAYGLWRRRRLDEAWVLLTIPAYWLLLSYAAWRALVDLVRRPTFWEKTEHGLSRRRDDAPAAAPVPVPAE